MSQDIGKQAKQGLAWTAIFNSLNFVVRFVSSIFIARLLFPEDFGLMGIAMIAVQFGRRLANFGFTLALVQKKEIDRIHQDTVFVVNTVFMSLIAVGLFFSADWIANTIFSKPKVAPVLAVIAIDFVLKAFLAVPRTVLSREMRIREMETGRSIGMFTTLVLPIPLALMGWGVWSLVYGNLVGTFLNVIVTTWYARWLPHFKFSLAALKDVFSFGIWATVNNIFNYFINKVDYTLIGIYLSTSMLGFYERAFNLMSLPRKRISKNVNHVLFAAYSRIQDDDERIVRALMRVTSYISFLVYPIMIWMYFAAPSLITVLYGEKWVLTIEPLQIMCFSGLVNVLTMLFQPILKAKALLKQYARGQLVYFVVMASSIYYGLQWGIVGVSWAVAFSSLVFFLMLFLIIRSKLKVSFLRFMLAQKSIMIYASVQVLGLLALTIYGVTYYPINSWQMLVMMTAFSAVIIPLMHLILRMSDVDEAFQDIMKQAQKMGSKLPVLKNLKFFTPVKKRGKKKEKKAKEDDQGSIPPDRSED